MTENKPVFGLFDPSAETDRSERDLPHWFQPEVAVFVTFRTADSLPKSALARMQAEVRDWLLRHGIPFPPNLPLPDAGEVTANLRQQYRQLKNRLFQWELDSCHGECLLREQKYSKIVMQSLRHFDGVRYDLDCAVVMPNHVHALVQFRPPTTCKKQCRSWLTYTARILNQQLGRSGPFWQSEAFDHLVRTVEQFEFLQRYIRQNGPQAKLNPGEYHFWKRGWE